MIRRASVTVAGLAAVGALVATACGSEGRAGADGAGARPVAPSRPTTVVAAATTAPTTTAARSSPAPPQTVAVPTTGPAAVVVTHAAHLDDLPAPAAAVPVGVHVDGAGISGPVAPVGVDDSTGELAVPPDAGVVAWYQYGPVPGAPGSAVLAAHVDWHGVPGVFFSLRTVTPDEIVTVDLSDGTEVSFRVVDVRRISKPELPVKDVFARSGPPTLVLITCGGSFNAATKHYRDNIVVTAVPL